MLLVVTFTNETMHNYVKCNFSNSIKKNENIHLQRRGDVR